MGLGRRTVIRFSLQDPLEEQALMRMHRSALHDRLTGIFNRGVLDDRLQSDFSASVRRSAPMSVLLIDVDHFKAVNDRFGHQAGDAVLCQVAQTLEASARVGDVVARYGGEEFAVVLRGLSAEETQARAELMRGRVEAQSISWGRESLRVTVSVGAAHVASARACEGPLELVQRADGALYAAKRLGRNQVVLADLDG